MTFVHHCLSSWRTTLGCLREDLVQLLPVLPRASGPMRRHVRKEPIQLGALRRAQLAAILQQQPSQAFHARIELLFPAAHLIDRGGGMRDHVELDSDTSRIVAGIDGVFSARLCDTQQLDD
jgi:hypothetical protein